MSVAGLLLGFFLLSPQFLVRVLSVYPGIAWVDDNSYSAMRSVQSEGRGSRGLTVYLVGASTMRETLSSERKMEERLSAALGEPVHVVDLTSSGQPFWYGEELALRAACGDEPGVLLLAVNMARTRIEPNNHARNRVVTIASGTENMLSAAKRNAEFARPLFATRVNADIAYVQRYARYLAGTGRKPAANPRYSREEGRHYYVRRRVTDEQRIGRVNRMLEAAERRGDTHVEAFSAAVENFAERLRACSEVEIVLVETPLNPEVLLSSEILARAHDRHLSRMSDLASRLDVHFLNLPAAVDYQPQDFFDHGHLRTSESIEKTTEVMAGLTETILKERMERQVSTER